MTDENDKNAQAVTSGTSASKESIKSSPCLKKSSGYMDLLPAIESKNLQSDNENNSREKKNSNNKDAADNPGKFTTAIEDLKKRRIEEVLAKKKQEEEERERFVKESAEKKAAERAEIIKQAKRLILYRKPMCRRINRALLVSECYRELDEQLKFQETLKRMDEEEETRYVNLMKGDVAKYEEEQRQTAAEQLEKQRKYAGGLKEQIEENERNTIEKETEEFEAAKQDQININKYLQDIKEHEEQEMLGKKQKLKQFFRDAIEEKKRFDLKLKQEEEFEDRAIEAYQNARTRIKKLHKEVQAKRRANIEIRANAISEQHRKFMYSTQESETKLLRKALEEQEATYQERKRNEKEREARSRKQRQDFHKATTAARLEQVGKAEQLKAWEMMQRFKRAEYNEEVELKEQGAQWKKKIEYGTALRRQISQQEAQREQDKLLEEKATSMSDVVEKENQRVLDYAEEVINESRNVRPLYPILKAVEECKREMCTVPLRKKEETAIATTPKRRQRRRVCTKFVPEDKICYL
ncbi:uncharacterized protein LOC117219133 isoform X2 [Megalopta genalis]|uniref:uncharacterized protein LOC117219133 isoform X2 n=1 Tax=Megalopta genalis TaxID=115081 RepID=UPI003FD19E6A